MIVFIPCELDSYRFLHSILLLSYKTEDSFMNIWRAACTRVQSTVAKRGSYFQCFQMFSVIELYIEEKCCNLSKSLPRLCPEVPRNCFWMILSCVLLDGINTTTEFSNFPLYIHHWLVLAAWNKNVLDF